MRLGWGAGLQRGSERGVRSWVGGTTGIGRGHGQRKGAVGIVWEGSWGEKGAMGRGRSQRGREEPCRLDKSTLPPSQSTEMLHLREFLCPDRQIYVKNQTLSAHMQCGESIHR